MAGISSRLPDLVVEEQLLRQALSLDPDFSAAWSALAWNFARRVTELGRSEAWSDSAAVAAQTALSLDASSGEAHLVMGSVYLNRGFLDRGVESLTRALDLDPNLSMAYFLLGRAYLLGGRFDEAILSLREALLRDPASPSIQSYIGLAFSFLGEMDRALFWMNREIQALDPKSAHRARMEAVAEVWRGDPEKAFRAGLRMVSAAPEQPRNRAYLSDLALQAGRCGPAVDHARRAMAMAPDPQRLRYAFFASTILGVALVDCGKPQEGELELERSKEELLAEVESGSQDPFMYLELSAVYEALGDRETAVIWVQKAYQQGFRQLRLLETHPLFQTLRQDPAVQDLMVRIRQDLARMKGTVVGVLLMAPSRADSAALAFGL
jgi:tetratricopeptide (TPR) repeat protein